MYLFIAIFGVVIAALVEAAVAKAAYRVDNVEERGQRNCVLLLLKTERVERNKQKYSKGNSTTSSSALFWPLKVHYATFCRHI